MAVRRRSQLDARRCANITGLHPADFPVGSVQSRAAARALIEGSTLQQSEELASALANLSPLELAISEAAEEPEVKFLMVRFVREVMVPKYEIYGIPLPTPQELRQARELSSVMAEIVAEDPEAVRMSDETLRELAESKLQNKKSAR